MNSYKLVYEKDGAIYGSIDGIPAASDSKIVDVADLKVIGGYVAYIDGKFVKITIDENANIVKTDINTIKTDVDGDGYIDCTKEDEGEETHEHIVKITAKGVPAGSVPAEFKVAHGETFTAPEVEGYTTTYAGKVINNDCKVTITYTKVVVEEPAAEEPAGEDAAE